MANSLRERRRQMLRDEILSGAGGLLAEKGYSAMSMDELAARVGISKPTLYSYFATKDELVVDVVVHELERLIAMIEAAPEHLTSFQRLVLLLRTIVRFHLREGAVALRQTPELSMVLCAHQKSRDHIQQLDTLIVSLIEGGIAEGEIDPALDLEAVALAFYGLFTALKMPALLHSASHHAPADTTLTDSLVSIFERGVQARPRSNERA